MMVDLEGDADQVTLLVTAWTMLGRARRELRELRAHERQLVAERRRWAVAVVELTALAAERGATPSEVAEAIASGLKGPLTPEALAMLGKRLGDRHSAMCGGCRER